MNWSLQKVLEWLKLIELEDEYIEVIKSKERIYFIIYFLI
jgi:hypothetical protein